MANGNGNQRPAFNLVALGKRNGEKIWVQVGAAWYSTTKDGKPFISFRMDSLPPNFEGIGALHFVQEREPGADDATAGDEPPI